jgi:hypothetical protein
LTAVLISRELLFATRLRDITTRAGIELVRVDNPDQLPPSAGVDLVLVDWADRDEDWAPQLVRWRGEAAGSARPRIVLFGPHTDLDAHTAAKASGLGPMWARSKLLNDLPALL